MQKDSKYKISTIAGVAIIMANMVGTGAFNQPGLSIERFATSGIYTDLMGCGRNISTGWGP